MPSHLLLESGSKFLVESGSGLLLESSVATVVGSAQFACRNLTRNYACRKVSR